MKGFDFMTINQYQKEAMRTASKKCRSLANCAMGHTGDEVMLNAQSL